MSRLINSVKISNDIFLDAMDIDEVIDKILELKNQGATIIVYENNQILGIKIEAETDEQQAERFKREHQADLVEFARLKAKLYPEQ